MGALRFAVLVVVLALFSGYALADGANATSPRLVKFSGTLANSHSTTGVTFAIYAAQSGGAPLWLETQNVTVDEKGRFTIYLGANHTEGLPVELFSSDEGRWLGVQTEGQPEQPRVLLVAVPYALHSANADMLGGLPASAYVLAPSTVTAGGNYVNSATVAQAAYAISGAAVNALPKFTDPTGNMTSSAVYEYSGLLGIGTAYPQRALHIKGTGSNGPNLRLEDTSLPNSFWELQQSAYMNDWFGFLRYDTSLGAIQAVPAKSLIISNEGKFGVGISDVYNKMSERVNIGAGNLKLWGTAGTDGIIFPDGSKQTTAATASGGGVASLTAGDASITIGGTATAPTVTIARGGVATDRLADASVTTAKLAEGAVSPAKLSGNGCTSGQVMKWNGAAWACGADLPSSGGTLTGPLSGPSATFTSSLSQTTAVTGANTGTMFGGGTGVYGTGGIGVAGESASGKGVYGISSGTGTAVYAAATGTGTALNAVSSTGPAGVFESTTAKILTGKSNGVEKFSVDAAGNVNATSFTGSGAGLTSVAQMGAANQFIKPQRIIGPIQLGSQNGTENQPYVSISPGYQGLVVRRIVSTTQTSGSIVARTNHTYIVRDGTDGGLVFRWDPNPGRIQIACTVVSYGFSGSASSKSRYHSEDNPVTAGQFIIAQDDGTLGSSNDFAVAIQCNFGDSYNVGHTAEINMTRWGSGTSVCPPIGGICVPGSWTGDSYWVGTLTTTYDQ